MRPGAQEEAVSFVAQMSEVDLRKLCMELKACGMLEDGIGDSPVMQAQKAVKALNLDASTVASLAGVKYEKPGEKGVSSSSKPPEPREPPREFTREKVKRKEDAKKKEEKKEESKEEQARKRKKEEMELAQKKEELREKYKSRNKEGKDEYLDENDLIAKAEEKKMQEQKERMKRKIEEKDSLDESDDEEEPDYGDDEEEAPEEEEERPPAVVLRENPSRQHEGWYQDDWQGDEGRREQEQAEEERYESRGRDREWSYGKGKGKYKSKGKSKSKGKDKYPRRWYEAPKISEENLIQSLIKKGERHQAEWIESLPRNKVTWDKLVAGGEGTGEPEFEIAIRLCVKKVPRHTGFAISPDCRYTKKFSIELKSVDDNWEIVEKGADPYDQEEFGDDKPLLFLACLIPESSLETQRSESRVREYDSLGDVVENSQNLNAFYANTCNDDLCRMALEDDLFGKFHRKQHWQIRRALYSVSCCCWEG